MNALSTTLYVVYVNTTIAFVQAKSRVHIGVRISNMQAKGEMFMVLKNMS